MHKAVIFDDEYIVVEGLRQMVDWNGLGIQLAGTANDGCSALELVRDVRPDLILTDIRMPGMDGLKLIELAAKEVQNASFIVFSGFNEFEYVKRAIQLGVADYLEKPFTIEHINQALTKVLGHISKREEMEVLRSDWEGNRKALVERALLNLLLNNESCPNAWSELHELEHTGVICATVLAFRADHFTIHASEEAVIQLQMGKDKLAVMLHRTMPGEDYWAQHAQYYRDKDYPIGQGEIAIQPADLFISLETARYVLKQAEEVGWTGLCPYKAKARDKNESKGKEAIEKALAYIHLNGMRDLSLAEVAEHVGLNAAYLSVLFKDSAGESFIKYLTRLRMEKAKWLLQRGLKVADVSERVGYHTYRHFSEVFKKYTGVLPGQYKEDPKNTDINPKNDALTEPE